MNQNGEAQQTLRANARLLDRIGWVILLLCAADGLANYDLLGGGLQVFLTTLAATLLVIGIVLRYQAKRLGGAP